MEAVLETDDPGAPHVLADDLHRVLHGLGAAVQHDRPLLEAPGGDLGEPLRKVQVGLVVDDVDAAVDQLGRLVASSLDYLVDAVAEARDPDA